MAETMRGLVKAELGPGVYQYREDLPIPTPGPGEVLLKVNVVALCGTDLHVMEFDKWTQNWVKEAPFIPGHEMCGEIVALGEGVTDRKVGDRVSCESHVICHECYSCTHDMSQVCENVELFGITMNGCFAEYAVIPSHSTYVLNDPSIPDELAVLFEPMGAGIHGVEKAEVEGKSVLISGCGPIGLTAVAGAKVLGAKKIFVCDIIDEKLEIAKRMGADVVINSAKEDVVAKVIELSGGKGVDASIDITGAQPAIVADVKALRPGGRFVGVALPTKEISLDLANDVFYREVEVTGISGRKIWETWDDFAKVMASPYFNAEDVLGRKFDIKDIELAVKAAEDGEPGKMLLYPGGVK